MNTFSFDELMNFANSNILQAQNYFEEQYSWKRFVLKDLNSITSNVEHHDETVIIRGLKLALQLIRKFECKIILLTIDFTEAIEDCCHYLENSISEYCATSLLHLKFIHTSEQSNLMKTVFTNLQTLEFQWCSISSQNIIFNAGFPNLRRLIFTGWNVINQDSMKIQFSALRELITTMFTPPHLRHFNITIATFINLKSLNPNLSTSIIAANDL